MKKEKLISETEDVVLKYINSDEDDLYLGDVVLKMMKLTLPYMTVEGIRNLKEYYESKVW